MLLLLLSVELSWFIAAASVESRLFTASSASIESSLFTAAAAVIALSLLLLCCCS